MTIAPKVVALLFASILMSPGFSRCASAAGTPKPPAIAPVQGRLQIVDLRGEPIPNAFARITQRREVGSKRFCIQISTFGASGGGGQNCTKYRLAHVFKGAVGDDGEQGFTVAYAQDLIIELVGQCVGSGKFPSRKRATRIVSWAEFSANPLVRVRGVDDGDHVGEVGCSPGQAPFQTWERDY